MFDYWKRLFFPQFQIVPALIAGGASLLGGIMSNQSNAKQARQQMQFQERMSSSAHQREVADLRAAGLNPILSGTGGMGSASPQGAQASMSDVITPAVSSAQGASRLKREVALMESQEHETDQRTATGREQENLHRAERSRVNADEFRIYEQQALTNQQWLTERERTREMKSLADLTTVNAARAASDWRLDASDLNRWFRSLEPGIRAAEGGTSALRNVLPWGGLRGAPRGSGPALPAPPGSGAPRPFPPRSPRQSPPGSKPYSKDNPGPTYGPERVDPDTGEIHRGPMIRRR